MSRTALISEIDLNDSATWQNKLFITIDIDWASDNVIDFAANFFEKLNVKVTWFVTHETSVLKRLILNKKFEIGIHPNLNPLLFDNSDNEMNVQKVIDKILEIVPNAKCIRNHCGTQNSLMLDYFQIKNLKYDCNTFIPLNSGCVIKPFKYYNDLIAVPYIWSDDVHITYQWSYKEAIIWLKKYKGIKVINCHPIHLYLNTVDLKIYENVKRYFHDYNRLKKYINNNKYGSRDFIKDMIISI